MNRMAFIHAARACVFLADLVWHAKRDYWAKISRLSVLALYTIYQLPTQYFMEIIQNRPENELHNKRSTNFELHGIFYSFIYSFRVETECIKS